MGATTTISVFHHDRYRSCVVPAVRRLLRSGELGLWLQAVWDHRQARYPATIGRPFSFEPNGNDETHLDADLLSTPDPHQEWFYLPDTQTMERANLIDLFEHAVEGCCLGECVSTPHYHWTDFADDDDIVFGTPELYAILRLLSSSASVWSDWSGGVIEGVRGWLNPTKTAELARELHRTELPSRTPNREEFSAAPFVASTVWHLQVTPAACATSATRLTRAAAIFSWASKNSCGGIGWISEMAL